jgi:hypothetical protein
LPSERERMCFPPAEYESEPSPRKVADFGGLPAPQELWLAGWVQFLSVC